MAAPGPNGPQGGTGSQGNPGIQGIFGQRGPQGIIGPQAPMASFVAQHPEIWQGTPPTTMQEAVDRLSIILYSRTFQSGVLPLTTADTGVIVDTNPRGSNDALITKYTTSGGVQWAARIGGTGNDFPSAISADAVGNVYATGQNGSNPMTVFNASGTSFGTLVNSGSNDTFVVKYDTNGVCQWVTRIGGSGPDLGRGISVDTTGNVYCIGYYISNPLTVFNANGTSFGTLAWSGSGDVFLVKYNTNGVCQWATRIGGGGNDFGNGISADAAGNVYCIGNYVSIPQSTPLTIFNAGGAIFGTLANSGNNDVFVIKYNTNGVCQWVTRIGGTGNDQGRGISVDTAGNVYCTGFYGSNPVTIFNVGGTTFGTLANSGDSAVFLVKYNTDGLAQWATQIGVSSSDFGNHLSTDAAGNVYSIGNYYSNPLTIFNVGGTTFGTLANPGTQSVYIVKYNTNGVAQWATRIGGQGIESANNISVDTAGNVLVPFTSGSTVCTIFNANGPFFRTIVGNGLVKYDTDGQGIWVASTPVRLNGVSTDPSTNVYTIGTVEATNPIILRGAGLQP